MLMPFRGSRNAGGGGGGGPWSPIDEASLQIWLDASDTSTITETGGAVSQISDKSGNGNHFAQSNTDRQPTTGARTINSLNALDFDGVDDVLFNTSFTWSGSSLQFVFVAIPEEHASTMLRAGGTARFGFTDGAGGNAGNYRPRCDLFGTNNVSGGEFTSNILNAAHVISLVFDFTTNDWFIYIDGALTHTETGGYQTAFNDEQIALMAAADGAGGTLDGAFAELTHFSNVDSAVRQKAEGFHAHKWGLEGLLPAGHPYKSSPP